MPYPHPPACIGNKRYAAACKRVVGKGGATHRHQERKYVTMSCHAAHTRKATSARPAPPTKTKKKNALRPGSGCHGRLTVLPCGAMRGKPDNCSYSTTAIFVALIRTYTLMHSVVCRIPTYTRCHASLCMHPPSLLFTGPKEKCVLVFAMFVR